MNETRTRTVDVPELLLTTHQVCALLKISRNTLYDLIDVEDFPVIRFSSRCFRFREKDIHDYLQRKITPDSSR